MGFWRTSFLLLIFANLVFYAWGQGYFGVRDEGREPERLAKQVLADKIRLVPDSEAASAASPAAAPAVAPPVAPLVPPPVVAPPPPPPPEPMACRRIEGLPSSEIEVLQKKAVKIEGIQWVALPQPAQTLYWVHIPPLASRAVADKKMAELKSLGVKDYHLMEEGRDALAISFGQFRNEEAAKTYLAALQKQGVRSAQLKPRDTPSGKVNLDAHAPAAVLKTLAATLGETIKLVDCPAGA